jgi:hypothetical protein
MNPDSAVKPTFARARGEPEVVKTPRHAVSKSFFAFVTVDIVALTT